MFNRMVTIAAREDNVEELFQYELTREPMSLFKGGMMRKPDKAALRKVIMPEKNAIVSIFKLLSADDDEKPVDRGIFQQHLEKLVSLEKLINRPYNRRNSYYIVNPTETTGELNVIDQPITIEPEQDKFFEPKLDNNENYTQNNSENDIVENKIRVLTAEIEAVKLFMKEQIYLLKKVVEEKNFKAENEGNTMLIELLCRQIKSLTDAQQKLSSY